MKQSLSLCQHSIYVKHIKQICHSIVQKERNCWNIKYSAIIFQPDHTDRAQLPRSPWQKERLLGRLNINKREADRRRKLTDVGVKWGEKSATPAEAAVGEDEMVDEVCFYCQQAEGLERCEDCGLVVVCADSQHWDLHRWGDSRLAGSEGNISDLTESVCPS